MSIHLSEDDRACLEQLEKRPMKPTRRQKAIALLRLDEGRSPAEAAQYAGISRERVEALATGFAESGLAGVGLGAKSKTLVRLVRPGVGVQKFCLPRGATLAELLRQSDATTTDQAVYVDGVWTDETVPLHDGAVVMIVPRPRNATVDEPWRVTIPSFRDEALFQQYHEILKSRRRDVGEDEDAGS
ncbi:MAG: hypothetical protein ACLQIB_48730 [Isosphaeraceae bacterium]